MVSAYENVALWHERDISHSSVERVIIPDATTLLHYALHRFARLIESLQVYPDTMQRNMGRTFGLFNSQRLLIALIDKGLSREDAYDAVQPLAMQAWTEARSFKEIVLASEDVMQRLTPEEVGKVFDARYHLRRVNLLFERAGLG